jgi:hypothetical protein
MSEFGHKRVVNCPVCEREIRSEDVRLHFEKAHRRDLAITEILDILSQVRSRPIAEKEYYADLERQEKRQQKRPRPERTPRSMQQWEGGTPREGMRSGPLGPGRG